MAIKLYYNPNRMKEKNFIITQEEFNSMWGKQTKELIEDEDYFNDWLNERFTTIEVFYMTKAQKEKDYSLYCSTCKREALKTLKNSGWKPFPLENS